MFSKHYIFKKLYLLYIYMTGFSKMCIYQSVFQLPSSFHCRSCTFFWWTLQIILPRTSHTIETQLSHHLMRPPVITTLQVDCSDK